MSEQDSDIKLYFNMKQYGLGNRTPNRPCGSNNTVFRYDSIFEWQLWQYWWRGVLEGGGCSLPSFGCIRRSHTWSSSLSAIWLTQGDIIPCSELDRLKINRKTNPLSSDTSWIYRHWCKDKNIWDNHLLLRLSKATEGCYIPTYQVLKRFN